MQRPLRAGERVAVIAPSSPFDPEGLAAGTNWLRERYEVADDARLLARNGFLAGDDASRAAVLLEAVRDPSVRAIFAARGGYGAMRVMERVGREVSEALVRDPKPVVGFSDVTALHALWARAGVRAVHGAMVAAIGRGIVRDEDRASLVRALEGGGDPCAPWEGLDVWRGGGRAEGVAAGGNLALLAALCGTAWAMPMEGTVLFLEDIGERPYRVDRMLTQLRLAGALAGVRAVVVGDFTQCDPGPDGVTVADVLRERLSGLGVPVLANAPFGHGDRQRAFVLGARVAVEPTGVVRFLE